VTQSQNNRILIHVLQGQKLRISAVSWSGGQLGKRWICKVVSWLRRLCQWLVCIGQLSCTVKKQYNLKFLQVIPAFGYC